MLATSRDAESLADAIEAMRRDPEMRRKMGWSGHETVVRDHDVMINTRDLYRIYMDHISRPA